jgi:Protein of unknown function (DUF2281)
MDEKIVYLIISDHWKTFMEQAILDKLQLLPAVLQEDALRYIDALVAQHTRQKSKVISRKDAFGIWRGEVWMADDFNASLPNLQDYM